MDEDLIHDWKGIAQFLDVSIRAAQRYEKNRRLPVQRKISDSGGSIIYAFRSELRAWLRNSDGAPRTQAAEEIQGRSTDSA